MTVLEQLDAAIPKGFKYFIDGSVWGLKSYDHTCLGTWEEQHGRAPQQDPFGVPGYR